MALSRWWGLARKALNRPPRYVVARAWHEVGRQARRPWGRVAPHLLTDRALMRRLDVSSIDEAWTTLAATPFFLHAGDGPHWSRRFAAEYPALVQPIVDEAERRRRHEFDLLGSGPRQLGDRLPWHEDFKTGHMWPLVYAPDIDYNELDRPTDVKVPWELSRCQHFARLGQAYWLTGDERFATAFVDDVTDWIAANPWTRGVNWACTMDVALRAVNWIWAFHFFAASQACQNPEFRFQFLRSLYLHGAFTAANLEWSDVNGNHYLCDGVGLVFLGVFFRRTRSGRRWLDRGRAIVLGEMDAQVWPDGVDFEQSTAYHRLVLEAFQTSCLLLQCAGERIPAPQWARLERMYDFVAAYSKPDGRAPRVGDADDGRIQILGLQPIEDHRYLCSTGAVILGRGDLKTAAGRCWDETFWTLGPDAPGRFASLHSRPVQSAAFRESGFYIARGGDSHLIVDAGEVGMRGRGGHGHNDVTSFELVLRGVNLFTDCGAYLYTASREWRNAFRSTASHNVLQIDGEELNRFYHADDLWRLQYDAVPIDVSWVADADRAVLVVGHRGYQRLGSPVTVHRALGLDWRRPLFALRDTLTGAGVHALTWRFHLDPALDAICHGADVEIRSGAGTFWLQAIDPPPAASTTLEDAWVSPSYGHRLASRVIVVSLRTHVPTSCAWLVTAERLEAADRRAALALLELN